LNTPAEATSAVRGSTVADLGERTIIARIQSRLPANPAWTLIGIGDDAAIVEPVRGALEVLTTDSMIEGVHFDLRFSRPFDIGWKALAVNLSDIAAMGAAPRTSLLSLALPSSFSVDALDQLVDGFLTLAREHRVVLAGGNITRSPGPLMVDVTATGAVRRRDVLRRRGAKPGDAVFVTGAVGAGLAGLEWLRSNGGGDRGDAAEMHASVDRYRRPGPRSRIGALLGRSRVASACMDLSDGLADAARQVADASGVGIRLDGNALPIDPGARHWFERQGRDPIAAAAVGGDDYELLFTVPRKRTGRLRHVAQQARGVPLTQIGEITKDPGAMLLRDNRLEPLPAGFVHF
jgi:thiamine-monophosphate kinase